MGLSPLEGPTGLRVALRMVVVGVVTPAPSTRGDEGTHRKALGSDWAKKGPREKPARVSSVALPPLSMKLLAAGYSYEQYVDGAQNLFLYEKPSLHLGDILISPPLSVWNFS